MHDRQVIRNAVRDRLLEQCGSLFDGRVHAGRAGAVMVEDEVPLALVDTAKSMGEIFAIDSSAEQVTYSVEVALVARGPSPELAAEGEKPCADALDDLALPVRAALKRDWALRGGLGVVDAATGMRRVVEWRFAGEDFAVRPAGNAGHLAHLTIRFLVTVINEDGEPAA